MKTLVNKIVAILLVALFVAGSASAQKKYGIDQSKSTLKWLGKKITGDHNGTIKFKSAEFTVDNTNKLTGGKFEIDMSSIKDEDLTDPAWASKLESHLKSEDFFNVEKFPVSTFEIKSPVQIQKGNTLVKGVLTIHGVSQPYEFKAVFVPDGENLKVFGKMIVDRSQFGVKYGSGSFFDNLGDKTIYDEFELYVSIYATKK